MTEYTQNQRRSGSYIAVGIALGAAGIGVAFGAAFAGRHARERRHVSASRRPRLAASLYCQPR
jgi:F0F1-type ATP synthase membrane subunit c/vacuolar-type H+-ATPase subunit K